MATFVTILRKLTWSTWLKWFLRFCHEIESDCLVISPFPPALHVVQGDENYCSIQVSNFVLDVRGF
jgi:hypothetical protein